MTRGKHYIGTSGWSYKHWKGIFYPLELPTTKWLEFYSDNYRIAEINTSFYHLPQKKTVENWGAKTPENFFFCPKISKYLSHIKRLIEPEEPLERFFNSFQSLKNKMGPVLVQLPPSFKFDYERAEYFYKLLNSTYNEYSFVMEVRHTTWLEEDSLTLMAKHKIGLVISQSNGRFPYKEAVTAKNVYFRFHGPDALYASSYSEEQLRYYAGLIKNWENEGHDVWAFFNNDINGFALPNSTRLKELCDE